MSRVFLRSDWNIKKISGVLILSLLPLILAGFYKNGIKLYAKDLIPLYDMFKPLIMVFLGFVMGVFANLIYHHGFKDTKESVKDVIFNSFVPLYGILIACVVSINTNLLLFGAITFIILLISKFIPKLRFNVACLAAIVIILISSLVSNYSFLNTYEEGASLNLSVLDYFIGMGSGGINTTYIILILASFIFLSARDYYKVLIPVACASAYTLCILLYAALSSNVAGLFEYLFVGSSFFSFVYLATDSPSSCYTRRGQTIYGALIGVLTFAFFLIYPPLAPLAAILIVSIISNPIDKLILKLNVK